MIVILDNGGQYVHRIHRSLKYIGVSSKIVPNTTPLEEIESNKEVKGIILSGGPDIEKAKNCIDIALNAKLPILGICLGHQLIALAYGGEVGRAEAEEYALTKVYVDKENVLFKNVPREFNAWASHKDEVKKVPEGFEILAHSDICQVEAMLHKTKPIYGVQFHPEVAHTEYGNEILKNFCKVCGYKFE
uniref:GMP synthase [glutamine-hydrolyzing] subunit A n=1 Tax=Methanocaldococcus jannaschii (strain ATCC 43067 / DSM 2661 / JAL-1 / JCM 10045 / NBRC 100440) TaxID=243232 RepID=UPI0025C74171|nr:Chain A, GMP synthase [glutamine-hydrolyzing] subunit A [Methanocaldococcus jannaschii DSM 2661]8GR1_B Chain B, GMP synthase [glutamine-hydrolyzing] subunit A [Methanocaldococcus jannaschii DSM 2661]8GR1_C Chain C, GMP synthase [glutamine-hydrolyzing] subunit A [Methanocaldococcus jannaschii DSM 2661]8GR1_D Chain D, GMP synthase [glutamine-hydrolyzing] subunit A [Methanocaldococcus jannaschii DSM 2661]